MLIKDHKPIIIDTDLVCHVCDWCGGEITGHKVLVRDGRKVKEYCQKCFTIKNNVVDLRPK